MRGNRGFIGVILLIVGTLVVLGFFGYDLKSIVDSKATAANLSYIGDISVHIWNIFVVTPAIWLWDKIQGIFPTSN